MRKATLLLAIVSGSVFIIHCSSSNTAGNGPSLKTQPAASSSATTKASGTVKTPPPAETSTTTAHPPKSAADAGSTKTSTPGPNCQALSTCCSKISNSSQQTSCLTTAGKANETVCTAAEKTFACDSLTTTPPTRGPSCTGLADGALYCGNDGPNGDPTTLYRCTGTTISIVRVCPGGCTTNAGVDDACAADTTTPPGANASCKGLSGDYCGTDAVSGNADTLYTCANDTIANTTICQNGCDTNADPTLNDSCAAAPTTVTVSCEGLTDEAYCGSDLGGDPDTLYTCSGGNLTGQTKCTQGCTVAAANVSDFCTGTSSPDCTGLTDGFYCGTNGVTGDPNTLYDCEDGEVQSNPTFCTFGCIAGETGGDDSCDGGG